MRRLNKQEMFSRAVTGLRSQGFRQCLDDHPESPEPVYAHTDGRRCAWGWVDRSLTPNHDSTFFVDELHAGIAPRMTMDELEFARELQWCHDDSRTPAAMERRLRRLGEREKLRWPE